MTVLTTQQVEYVSQVHIRVQTAINKISIAISV